MTHHGMEESEQTMNGMPYGEMERQQVSDCIPFQ